MLLSGSRSLAAAAGVVPMVPGGVAWVGLSVLVLAAALAFAYGSEEVLAAVMMGGSLTLLVAWFGSVIRGWGSVVVPAGHRAEAPAPLLEVPDRLEQNLAVEVRPEDRREPQLGVGGPP